MPMAELCSTCFIRRLAIMQSSQYSIYNDFFKSQLEYAYKQCKQSGPTDILPPLTPPVTPATEPCLTGGIYTTKDGDTCESVGNSTNTAGWAVYMANQDMLTRCNDLSGGMALCLPLTCDTYYLGVNDTCDSIETSLQIEDNSLLKLNPWLLPDCSNLKDATDFYGKNICVSPQGEIFNATWLPPSPTPNPNAGDGYASSITHPPAGARVAIGTTLKCGRWYVVKDDDTCSTICVPNRIDIHLFLDVNPSLQKGNCSSDLVVGTAVCVGPVYGWNSTDTSTPSSQDTSIYTIPPAMSSSTAKPASTSM